MLKTEQTTRETAMPLYTLFLVGVAFWCPWALPYYYAALMPPDSHAPPPELAAL